VNDVQVLAGPPWWTGWRLVRLICLALLLVFGGVYLYVRLSRWKMNVILSERERLAHDLHDTLAQSFAGIGFHLQGLYNGLRSGSTPQGEAVEMLQGACDMVAESHREASACIGALHPDTNDGQDFLVALERSTNEMLHSRQIKIKLPLLFIREGVQQPISIQVRDAFFHIGREAITNMIRHARATQMEIKLGYESKTLVMEVQDDGVGFPAESVEGLGIRGMRRRAAKIGAQISIASVPGRGTTVSIRAPYGKRPTLINWLRSFLHRPQPR
jgi:signal transduction histidine kinase